MHFSSVVLALAALSVESVIAGAAGGLKHAGFHYRREAVAAAAMEKRDASSHLSGTGLSTLKALGFGSQGAPATGVNANAAGACGIWFGSDGAYTSEFHNAANAEIVLVAWGSQPAYQASFPMAVQPLITASIAPGQNVTLSFAEGQSGAWAPVYPNTKMTQWGQIQNTWGEFTMSPSGVVDVSREVFMNGNTMEIVGPSCTTNMNKCSFQCKGGATTCADFGSYQLLDCAAGSQPGAQVSPDGADGGCGWLGATKVALTTTFS